MRKLLLISAALVASNVSAQETVVESVEDVGHGSIIRTRQTLDLPDEIGFAFIPYTQCLSNGTREIPDDDWLSGEKHSSASVIQEQCQPEKTKAVFLAATALERIGQLELEDREALILQTFEAVENFMLLAPVFPGMPSPDDPEKSQND